MKSTVAKVNKLAQKGELFDDEQGKSIMRSVVREVAPLFRPRSVSVVGRLDTIDSLLDSILADDVKYPQLKLHERTRERIEDTRNHIKKLRDLLV